MVFHLSICSSLVNHTTYVIFGDLQPMSFLVIWGMIMDGGIYMCVCVCVCVFSMNFPFKPLCLVMFHFHVWLPQDIGINSQNMHRQFWCQKMANRWDIGWTYHLYHIIITCCHQVIFAILCYLGIISYIYIYNK